MFRRLAQTCTKARIYACRATASARSNRSPNTPLQTRCRPGTVSSTPNLLIGPRSTLRYPQSLTTQSKKREAFTPLYPSEPVLASRSHAFIHDCVSLCLISQSTFYSLRRPTQGPMTPSSQAMFASTESVTTTPPRKPGTFLPSEHTNDLNEA
jgi:hypothetical protein